MARRYRGRRRSRKRGVYVSPLLIVAAVVLVILAVLLIRGLSKDKPADDKRKDPPVTEQDQIDPGRTEEEDGEEGEDPPKVVTTSDGVVCTLTDLGADAIYTGELVLVNNWTHYVFPEEEELVCVYEEKSDSYIVARTDIYVKPVAMEALDAMLDDFRAQGGSKTVNVVAGYRTEEYQQHLFDQSAERNGLAHAQKYVAQPGGSEHHTGLVVDFSILNPNGTSSNYDGTGEYAWINENCVNYGYVVRYEPGKEEQTGIWDEPWHFRYVGRPHATKMAELDLCLEEYIDYLKDYTFEGEHLMISCGGDTYEVWYAQGQEIHLPDSGSYLVSGNNVDGLVVTYKVGS